MSEPMKHWLDAGAVIGLFATFVGWAPQVTALVMLVWGLMRAYETYQNIKLNARKLRGD